LGAGQPHGLASWLEAARVAMLPFGGAAWLPFGGAAAPPPQEPRRE